MTEQDSTQKQNQNLFEKLPGKPILYYLGVYLIVTIALFHLVLFDWSKLIFGTDLLEGNVFFRHFLIDYFRANFNWPVWDPYIHGGMPFVEGMHGDIFYIPSLIFYFTFGFFYAWGFLLALHVFSAGLFMYLFLRQLKIRGMISFLGGLMYMMAPFLISLVYAGHNGKIFIIALTPLLFFIYEKASTTCKLIYYILLSFMILLILTTPHMQLSYYLFIALGMYFVAKTFQNWRKDGINPVKPALLFTTAVIIGLLMSSVQFVTPYQYLQEYSMRTIRTGGENKYEYATSWSMNFEEVTADFFPEFCGDNIQGQRSTYWGPNFFKLNSEHFGIIPLFLAILAIGLWNRRGKWYFFWTAIITTLYALGANTPAFKLFYMVPGIKSFRAPSTINFLIGFSVITLGCMGLEAFFLGKGSSKTFIKTWKVYTYIAIGYSAFALLIIFLQMNFFKIWFAIFGSPDQQKAQTLQNSLDLITLGAVISLIAVWGIYLMLKFAIAKKFSPKMIIAAAAIFTITYMWYFNSRFIISYDPKPNFARTPVVDFLKNKQNQEQFRAFIMPRTLPDYYLAYHGIEELSLTALHGNHLATFEKLAGKRDGASGLIYQPVQDLLNARYFLSNQALPPQYFNPDRFKMINKFGNIMVYENLTALPRAFPIYRYTIMQDQNEIIRTLSDTVFDYRSTVIFEEMPDNPPPVYADSLQFPVAPARVYDSENGSFKVDVDMVEDGFLFLSENYYQAWHAYENGDLLPTLKADLNFRAIFLPKGKHTIECKFENRTFNATFAISRITFILLILLLAGLIIKDKYLRKEN